MTVKDATSVTAKVLAMLLVSAVSIIITSFVMNERATVRYVDAQVTQRRIESKEASAVLRDELTRRFGTLDAKSDLMAGKIETVLVRLSAMSANQAIMGEQLKIAIKNDESN